MIMQKLHIYALIDANPSVHPSDFASVEMAHVLARQGGIKSHALILGSNTGPAIEHAKALGLDAITTLSLSPSTNPLQAHQLADAFVHLIAESEMDMEQENAIFLVSSGSECERIAGQLAARLQAAPLGKAIDLRVNEEGCLEIERAAFSGRLIMTIEHTAGACVICVRNPSHAGGSSPAAGHQTCITEIHSPAKLSDPFDVVRLPRAEQHASLEGAKIVISGGRGMGDNDGFSSLYALADKLGGAVGSSLPAVDAGWAPVARQVGQSGKYVSPDIYVAIGISGTPQHMAGIDPETRIIAINNDPEASIFKVAHIGAVTEWQALLPPLLAAIDKQRQG